MTGSSRTLAAGQTAHDRSSGRRVLGGCLVVLLVLLVMFLVVKLGHAITDAAAEP